MKERRAVLEELLVRHGQSYAQELGLAVERNTPAVLFQLLCAALMFSARISATAAVQAHGALRKEGLTTPQKMAAATWERRTRILNENGYARYDEKTSRMLGEAAERLLQTYKGDLRGLRDSAERDPAAEHRLLQTFKGIGSVGADIFCREVQVAWDELYPFVDDRAQAGARDLGLSDEPEKLAGLVDRRDFPRLVGALVRTELAGDGPAITEAARR